MSEESTISRVSTPNTKESLIQDLCKLGLQEGTTVIIHSSLSALGYVVGGPITVIQALLQVVTLEGTIVMPTQSADYSDPSEWEYPPVPKSWWPTIRQHMPAYDPAITPTRGMGQIVEVFRRMPGVIRSSHPWFSFAALGKQAEEIIHDHSLDYTLGEHSPLARIYQAEGKVLLLGVGYESNTSFHLSEYRAPGAKSITRGAPIMEEGERVWKTYHDIDFCEELFDQIGTAFEETGRVVKGRVGAAEARLFSQRETVDFAVSWLKQYRSK